MKVWLFTMSQRINDAANTRTFLIAQKLIDQGCEVTLWTSAFDHITKKFRQKHANAEILPNGVRVVYLAGCGYSVNVSVKRYVDHWLIARRFPTVAKKMAIPDVGIISLPDHHLAAAACRYLKRMKKLVIVDVRDQWPDIFKHAIKKKWMLAMAKCLLWRDRQLVARTMRDADSVVSMMNSLLIWAQDLGKRKHNSNDRVFYLSTNTKIPRCLPTINATQPVQDLLKELKGRPYLLYVGTFGIYYNPMLLIKSLQEINRRGKQRRFAVVIVGSGVNFDEIKRAACLLEGIYVTGWLNKNDIDVLVSHASAGVIPCNLEIDAFPNKSFTYLSGGLPVISSVGGDLAEAISERAIGLNFRAGDTSGLADRLLSLEEDEKTLKKMKEKVRQFFDECLDSDRTYEAYAAHVFKLAKQSR